MAKYTIISYTNKVSQRDVPLTEEQVKFLESQDFCVIKQTSETERQDAMVTYGD